MSPSSNQSSGVNIVELIYQEIIQHKSPSGSELIVLAGPPYSGKSTYALELEKRGYVHVWLTVLKRRFSLEDEEALDFAESIIERLLINGYSTVFDFINHKTVVRNRFFSIADNLGVKKKLIWFDVPIDELYRRRQQAVAGEGRSDISKEIINKIIQETEIPEVYETPASFITSE